MKKVFIITANKNSECLSHFTNPEIETNLDVQIMSPVLNGVDAISLVKLHHPDVIFINIPLVDIDPFDLVRLMRKENDYPCKFVLICQDRTFEIAYQALKNKIDDLLIAPIDTNDVKKVLWDLLYNKEDNTDRNEKTIVANTASRLLFIKREIANLTTVNKTVEEINALYGTMFREGLFRALILKMDCPDNVMSIFENDPLRNMIITLVEETFQELCYDVLYDKMSDGVLVLLNYSLTKQREVHNAIENFFPSAKTTFSQYKGIRLTLCVSREYSETSKLPEAKFEVLDARWSRMKIGTGRIIFSSSLEEDTNNDFIQKEYLQRLSDQIIRAFEVLDVEKGRKYIQDFFGLHKSFLSTRIARVFTRSLIDRLFDLYFSFASVVTDAEALKHEFIYRVNMANSFDQLQTTFCSLMSQVMTEISDTVNQHYSKPVRDAILYVGKNCCSASLNIVAKEVNLAPAYLSSIFRKETGQTFSEYVTSHKINIAKEFLKKSQKNISEIADELDYDDVRNFSKFFKKNVGVSPTEYKKIYRI